MLAFGSFLTACAGLQAQDAYWAGQNGDGGAGNWGIGSHWSGGIVPSSASDVIFLMNGTYTEEEATITVDGATEAKNFIISGKTAILNLDEAASLESTGYLYLTSGYGGSTGTGPSSFTLAGPSGGTAATASAAGYLFTSGNTSLTIAGNIDFSVLNSAEQVNQIGFESANSTFKVMDGARVTTGYMLRVGHGSSGNANNQVVISGTGSSYNTAGGLQLAAAGAGGTPGQNAFEVGNSGNSLKVEDGAALSISGLYFSLGTAQASHSNSLEITGEGSTFTYLQAAFAPMQIGESHGFGGNRVEINDGGSLNIINTNVGVLISGYDANLGFNAGSNRLIIGENGTFSHTGIAANAVSITNDGLVQLAASGTLSTSGMVNVRAGGRIEAAGSGYRANNTHVRAGATFAVGLGDVTSASSLDLEHYLGLYDDSTFEIGIFGADSNDQLNLAVAGVLDVGANVTFSLTLEGYIPQGGETWTILTGLVESGFYSPGALANFQNVSFVFGDLQEGLTWDTSNFNLAGGWQIGVAGTAIPEPSSYVLIGLAAGGIALFNRRQKRSN